MAHNRREEREDELRRRPRVGEFGGYYARDEWNEDLGGDYARDPNRRGLGGDYARDTRWGGTGARGDYFLARNAPRSFSDPGFGPAQGRGAFGGDSRNFGAADSGYRGTTGPANLGGRAEMYGGIDPMASHRGRGPRNYRRSDARIAEEVNERLTDDRFVDATDIEVEVANGEVTLTGTVDSRNAKRRAEDIAENCFGVVDVHNRLRVNLDDEHIGKASE